MVRECSAISVIFALTLAFAGCTASTPSSSGTVARGVSGAARTGLGRVSSEADRGPGDHQPGGKTLNTNVHHDTSPPLRTIRPLPAAAGGAETAKTRDDVLPRPGGSGHQDPLLQRAPATRATPTMGASWDGLGDNFSGPAGNFVVNAAPPDTNSAVGPKQVVEMVNTSFAVFNKSTGAATYGPAATNTLFTGFGGGCETTNDGDGVVRYDRLADRFVITQFAVGSGSGPFYECLAISATSDPTGAYHRYSFQYANFPDYPKLGIWPDAYYVTYNVFTGVNFQGGTACAMDRAALLTGASATQQCFSTNANYGGLLPADLEGATPPPSGAPGLLMAMGATNSALAFWKFHVDWATPARSTFSGPTQLAVSSYNPACTGMAAACIVQPATSTRLDSMPDRLMFRLAYRNFGNHEALVVTHPVTVGASSGSSTGIRWYELRMSGGDPYVYQQGTYAPDASYRWMSSAAFDGAGDIGVGYSVSSSMVKPSLRVTGRLAGDATGTLTQGEASVMTGSGSQTGDLTRWGDYASMNVDPSDDCTFWFASEYLTVNGSFNWHTRNGSFKLPGCGHGAPGAPAFISGVSGNGQVKLSWSSPFANGSPVTGYTITPYVGAVAQTPQVYGSAARTETVAGLTNGTSYTFTVQATNAVGTGPASTSAAIPAGLPDAPAFLSGASADASAKLTWWSPSGNGSAITGYVVTPFIGTTAQTPQKFNSPSNSITVVGLTNGTTYTFKVAAINGVGTGPTAATTPVLIGLPGAPGHISGSSGDTQASLKWLAPPSNGSTITSYIITPYVGTTALAAQSSGSSPAATVTGLTNGTTYTFKIQAVNGVGTGPAGTSPTLLVGLPGPPVGLQVAAGRGQATVQWKGAAPNGSAIGGYTITTYTGSTVFSTHTYNSPNTSEVVTGLTNGTRYTFKVQAINHVGTGPAGSITATI